MPRKESEPHHQRQAASGPRMASDLHGARRGAQPESTILHSTILEALQRPDWQSRAALSLRLLPSPDTRSAICGQSWTRYPHWREIDQKARSGEQKRQLVMDVLAGER